MEKQVIKDMFRGVDDGDVYAVGMKRVERRTPTCRNRHRDFFNTIVTFMHSDAHHIPHLSNDVMVANFIKKNCQNLPLSFGISFSDGRTSYCSRR